VGEEGERKDPEDNLTHPSTFRVISQFLLELQD
jgi:hypothetical protein